EFINRLKENKNLPILTSCCPAWINYLEHHYPECLNLASSCKSPQNMFGAIAKNYFTSKINISPKDITV
ncbi:NADH:ubiquinone oxidoreductase, partial [Casaltella massiliensis]|nr:NADH:ubiquinone oxidoreductase [Casaltella massiliensis]